MNWLNRLFHTLCATLANPFAHREGTAAMPGATRAATNTKDCLEVGGSPTPGFTLRQVLRGHPWQINRIAWSPDGAYLASPSRDGTIRIWDVSSGACLRVLQGAAGSVASVGWVPVDGVAWSPDGQRLAAAQGKVIHLWAPHSGQLLQTLVGHAQKVNCVGWSPAGQQLASGSVDTTVRVWDAAQGQPLQVLHGHPRAVTSLAWSPNGQQLASTSQDVPICLWEPASGHLLQQHLSPGTASYCIVWSPDGQGLVVTCERTTLLVWDVAQASLRRVLKGRRSKRLRKWRAAVAPDQTGPVLKGHSGAEVICATFSADGQWLASKGQEVCLWRWADLTCVASFTETPSIYWLASLAFHPSRPLLATLGAKDTVIRLWALDAARIGATGE